MKHRLQNRVAESTATLPVAAVTAAILWWLPQGCSTTPSLLGLSPLPTGGWSVAGLFGVGLGLLGCMVTAYIIVEASTQNSLLRLRSRMDSALFLFVMAAFGILHPLSHGTATLPPLAGTLFCLMRSYEKTQPQIDTFHAYLCLSIASLSAPPLLLLTPIFILAQAVYLRSLTWQGVGAMVCGLVTPYLLWACGALALEHTKPLVAHAQAIVAPFSECTIFHFPLTSTITKVKMSELRAVLPCVLTLSFTALLALTGGIHYVRHSYDDKIRVRMCHYTFLLLLVVTSLWLVLQPQYVEMLLPLIILVATPSAAHFIALTHTRASNAWFVIMSLLLAITACITLIPQQLLTLLHWPK